jgi:ATP-dependent RNA helicase MRH4, mitochondrial
MSFINDDSMSVHRLLSPSLHRLPTKLKTRFVPWSGSGNKLADVVHEVKRVISADATDRALLLEGGHVEESEQKAKILIFCNSPGRVKMLADTLTRKNVPCVAWTGEGDDRVRGSNGTLNQFLRKPGQTDADLLAEKGTAPRVLVTTSLLSRGLDFTPAVKHVFLLDEPRDMLDFLHRAGRTGRAGRVGNVVVFGDAARDRFSKMMKSTRK